MLKLTTLYAVKVTSSTNKFQFVVIEGLLQLVETTCSKHVDNKGCKMSTDLLQLACF